MTKKLSCITSLGGKVFLTESPNEISDALIYLLVSITEKVLQGLLSLWLPDQKPPRFIPHSDPGSCEFKERVMKCQPISLLQLKPLLHDWVLQCKLLLECTM